jgi:hypothetical protein
MGIVRGTSTTGYLKKKGTQHSLCQGDISDMSQCVKGVSNEGLGDRGDGKLEVKEIQEEGVRETRRAASVLVVPDEVT